MEQLGDFIKSSIIGRKFVFGGCTIVFTKTSLLIRVNGEELTIPFVTKALD
jgi:hypothetical protein